MQRSLVESVISPSAARRLVEYHLNGLRGVERESLFIGREKLLGELSEKLIPAPESAAPRILIVGGLPGVGRRTFLGRALKDFLSLRVGAILTMQPSDGLDALHLALLDELGALDTKTQIALAIEQFQNLNLKERGEAAAQMLASSSLGNAAPIIIDQGSLIDSSGKYSDEAISLFEGLKKFPDVIVGVIHTRRPNVGDGILAGLHGVYTRVPPLDRDATMLLINQTLRRAGIRAESGQVAELASYIEGYPPAVNLAVALAQQYGLPTVMADKSGLVDFQFRTFAGIIEKLKLRGSEWEILRILATEAVLPFETLVAVLRRSDSETATALRRLIDLNLVLNSGTAFQIAFPVKFAVQSLCGRLTSSDFSLIAAHLKSQFWDSNDLIPPFEVIQATIYAVMRSDNPDLVDFKGFVLPSMLFRVAKDNYAKSGQEGWDRAEKLLHELLQVAPKHKQGLILLCKVQVRLNDWVGAEKTLAVIRNEGFPEQHFLQGFLLWKRREFAKAITAFRAALSLGQNSIEVYHGLATCLFRLDQVAEAEKVIRSGVGTRARPNSLLLDLAAQISIARGNFHDAELYVDQLRRVKADDYYHHRMATLLNAKNRFQEALRHAELALHGSKRRFEVEATLVNTLIEVGSFDRARQALNELNKHNTAPANRDVRTGLGCKLYLRMKKWKDADELWSELADKSLPVHRALRQEILQQQIDDVAISPGIRATARKELEQLKSGDSSDQRSLFLLSDVDSGAAAEEDEDESQTIDQ